MRIRRVLIALFALGTVGGYGSAIAGASCHARARRAAWEQHIAHVCIDAAKHADPEAAFDHDPSPW
jgi:TPP-dependent trihydroxycyclohexane-1,2-dione (THcHDO) dehydratase